MSNDIQTGFTLIEMLAILAIVFSLTAILLPVLAAARRASYRAACASNLRQIGSATVIYASAWDGALPPCFDMYSWGSPSDKDENPVEAWEMRVRTECPLPSRYLATVGVSPNGWRCPADCGGPITGSGRLNSAPIWERFGESYLYISSGIAPDSIEPGSMPDIDVPVAWDHMGFWHSGSYWGLGRPEVSPGRFRSGWRFNVVYWDGSVRSVRAEALYDALAAVDAARGRQRSE